MTENHRILAVANQKGGVGKTTTAVNLAAAFAVSERSTLLVDLDPQGNATSACGLRDTTPQVYDVLLGRSVMKDAIHSTELDYLHVVPSGRDLVGAEIELVSAMAREHRLERGLADVRDDYKLVVIDCPPSLGLLTLNALTAADAVVIPLQAEYYALEGLASLLDTIERVRTALNPGLALEGVLLTMTDARNKLSGEVAAEVRQHLGDKVFTAEIPRNVRLSEAPSFGKPALVYDVRSRGSVAYLQAAEEILRRMDGGSPSLEARPSPEPRSPVENQPKEGTSHGS